MSIFVAKYIIILQIYATFVCSIFYALYTTCSMSQLTANYLN